MDKDGINTALALIVVIILVAVAGAAIFLATNNDKEATIIYTVEITPSEELDLFVYIDGKEVFSEKNMEPGMYYERTRTYFYEMSGDSNVIEIEAETKNKSGGQIDRTTKLLEVHPGETYDITLHFEGGHSHLGYSVSLWAHETVDVMIYLNGHIFMPYNNVSGMWSRTNMFSYPIQGSSAEITFKVDILDMNGDRIKTDSKTVTLHVGGSELVSFKFGELP